MTNHLEIPGNATIQSQVIWVSSSKMISEYELWPIFMEHGRHSQKQVTLKWLCVNEDFINSANKTNFTQVKSFKVLRHSDKFHEVRIQLCIHKARKYLGCYYVSFLLHFSLCYILSLHLFGLSQVMMNMLSRGSTVYKVFISLKVTRK